MPVSLTQAAEEAMASAPDGVVMLHTLEFRHSSFAQPLRVVLDYADATVTLEADAPADPGASVLFVGYNFQVTLPPIEEAATPEMSVAIANVSREILRNLLVAAVEPEAVEVTYRLYLSTVLTAPQMDPFHVAIRSAHATVMAVEIKAGFGDDANKRFPNETYTARRFPGLARN